jgi:hypothetical protein
MWETPLFTWLVSFMYDHNSEQLTSWYMLNEIGIAIGRRTMTPHQRDALVPLVTDRITKLEARMPVTMSSRMDHGALEIATQATRWGTAWPRYDNMRLFNVR